MFGAMLGSAILHGGGWTTALLPAPVTTGAMIAIGAVTGSRFAATPPRLLTTYLAAALGSFAVSVLIAESVHRRRRQSRRGAAGGYRDRLAPGRRRR